MSGIGAFRFPGFCENSSSPLRKRHTRKLARRGSGTRHLDSLKDSRPNYGVLTVEQLGRAAWRCTFLEDEPGSRGVARERQ